LRTAVRPPGTDTFRRWPATAGWLGRLALRSSVQSREVVDEAMKNAVAAGGGVVKEAADSKWGGYFGYFSDPDGHLWKVASY
jgi:uncharacterized protein